MTAGPAAVIDRVTLVVSDLDRAEDDYVRTFGCRVEHRGDIDPALVRVLCIRRARGRRSLLRLGRERIELLEFTEMAGARTRSAARAPTCGSSTWRSS